ncbi:MAG: outer membrane protein assembly factor BamD [Ignavibacteriae bacterium]|nr:MAG: outer membrane protein assembly factor BamD [Ignavibacteriota bacterium]
MLNRLLENNLKKVFIYFSFIAVSVVMVGCGSSEATKQLSAEERFSLGMNAFKDEDYLGAIDEFKVVSLQYQGSRVADSAQFYLAESRFHREEYILAAFEYDILIRTMPASPLVSRARFKRASCYFELSPKSFLDQNYSRKAIDEYQAFIEYHPADTLVSVAEQRISELNAKLAQKDFENGMTYMHMEYYKAAGYYFDMVLDKYHDSPYAEPSLLRKAETLAYRKKYTEAKETLQKFFEKYAASTLKPDAEKLHTEIESGLREEKTNKQKTPEPMKDTSKQVPQTGG